MKATTAADMIKLSNERDWEQFHKTVMEALSKQSDFEDLARLLQAAHFALFTYAEKASEEEVEEMKSWFEQKDTDFCSRVRLSEI